MMIMNNDENLLELLEIYMDLVEKQDEIISGLSKMLKKLATDLQHYKNLSTVFGDEQLDNALRQYEHERKNALK